MTPLVRSATFAKYSAVARGLGIDPVRMVSHAGLDRSCLVTPDLRVPEASLAEVLDASARAASCASLGLLVGESWRLSDFGVISLLLQHQPTLRQALQELRHYRHLLSDSVVVDVSDFPTVSVVRLALVTGRAYPGRQPMELAMGVLLSLCRHQLGQQWMPRSVHFTHAAPQGTQIHRRMFGGQLEFGSEFDGLVLAAGELDKVNPLCDARMAGYAKDFVDLQPRKARSVAHEVRRAVHVQLPRGRCTVDLVAQSLGLSARTLQRQMEQEGVSFLSVVNEVRRDLAVRYLAGEVHSVSQVAELLGFAQVSVFSRWFSQQYGCPPSRWNKP
ncbi:AraC family transcriptional regulator [Ramlibacter sp. MAHUQ-53]|uniref:AraC family transcriptional regulator n=1 Tax=unclassified Ramlibacter TaxID=2617605 RepID=UPI003635D6BB